MSSPAPATAGLVLALAAFLAGCGEDRPRSVAPGRALVLITCDTLRADRLGFEGCPDATSPHLDALARESLVYEHAWSTVPVTGPALSALMTGRLPEELGLEGNRTLLAGAATTLAERLREAGVDTGAVVSNWVLRRRDGLSEAGLWQGFAHFDDRMEVPERSRPHLRERLAPDTTDAALDWLDQRPPEQAFFLWVHYQDPHGPYTPPEDCLVAARETDEAPLEVGNDESGRGALPAYQAIDGERRPAVYRARYEAEIRFFDREVGRLLDGLRERGVLERALVVFTADHGESLGEHGYYFSHGQNLHRELLQVPLLLRPPGGAPTPGRVAAPVSHLDLYPTLLGSFGLDAGRTRGIDLLRTLPPEERVLPHYLRGAWGATDAGYRLLVEKGRHQLFDLALDPHEEHDLFASQPERARALAAAHLAFARALPSLALQPERPGLDDAERQGLEALGYAGGRDEPEADGEPPQDDH